MIRAVSSPLGGAPGFRPEHGLDYYAALTLDPDGREAKAVRYVNP